MKYHVDTKELIVQCMDIALDIEGETMVNPYQDIRDASYYAMIDLAAIGILGNMPAVAKVKVLQDLYR